LQIRNNSCRSLQILANLSKSRQILELQIHVDLCKSLQILRIRCKSVQILPKPKKIQKSTLESAQDPRKIRASVSVRSGGGCGLSLLSVRPLADPCRSLQILGNPYNSLQILANPCKPLQILANPRKSMQIVGFPCRSLKILANPRESSLLAQAWLGGSFWANRCKSL
jgi:hypothetical protein